MTVVAVDSTNHHEFLRGLQLFGGETRSERSIHAWLAIVTLGVEHTVVQLMALHRLVPTTVRGYCG